MGGRVTGKGRSHGGAGCGEAVESTRIHFWCGVHKVFTTYKPCTLLSVLDYIFDGCVQLYFWGSLKPHLTGEASTSITVSYQLHSPSFPAQCLTSLLHVHTSSWLSRAIETAWLVLDELDSLWLPIIKTWRLNERWPNIPVEWHLAFVWLLWFLSSFSTAYMAYNIVW